MTLRDLPLLRDLGKGDVDKRGAEEGTTQPDEERHVDGSMGGRRTLHMRARDAYRGVPILQRPTWKNQIAAYFYLGGISSGAFTLGALADLVGGARWRRVARTAHYVAFASMAPCPILLIGDLGKPARFHHMLRIFKPSSPMNLGAWALTIHGAFSTLLLARVLAGEGKLPVVGGAAARLPRTLLGAGGIPTALTLGGYTGVLLGTTSTPVWFKSPLLGGLFMASAFNSGAAAITLVDLVTAGDEAGLAGLPARLHRTLDVVEGAALAGYVATSGQAAAPLLKGRTGLMIGGAAAASVGAMALEAAGQATGNRRLKTLAAGTALIGTGLVRWGVVQAGQVSAADREGTLAAMQPSRQAPGWDGSNRPGGASHV